MDYETHEEFLETSIKNLQIMIRDIPEREREMKFRLKKYTQELNELKNKRKDI